MLLVSLLLFIFFLLADLVNNRRRPSPNNLLLLGVLVVAGQILPIAVAAVVVGVVCPSNTTDADAAADGFSLSLLKTPPRRR